MPNVPVNLNAIQRSALDLIRSACRLTGALRAGINLTNAEQVDCLQVLNDMMDALSAERTNVFVVQRVTNDINNNVLSLKANQATYSLGVMTGLEDFMIPRPARIQLVSLMYSASQQTPVELALDMPDASVWQGYANKSTPSLLPQACYIEENFPDMTLTFWPVPTQANPIVLYNWALLTNFQNLQTKLSFPPGYNELIRYNLAIRLAAEFPCDLTKLELVKELAMQAIVRVSSHNVKPLEAHCDPALVGSDGKMGNIYTSTATRSNLS